MSRQKWHIFKRDGAWCCRLGRHSVGKYYQGNESLSGITYQLSKLQQCSIAYQLRKVQQS